ncbi:hypothetical protein K431DRAFT_283395 [Polychaeton citri CBS 116435]|uniref:Mitochondrial K+-H+ exchange-related-domain-containing protein n=1 Tax=Polychaeton citri CBS 116435 TaxID=1314669 RepID=A0A9P4QDL8_9PEZI|nr:hypothetical protein K431DRAFT_283395 [Polychaeton citri CBS 116435]
MRLFLLPVSKRRTLIYCERVQEQLSGAKPPVVDRITNKANETWVQWENAEKGWKKKVTEYGNQLFKRIPYQEWGLKSIPPLTQRRIREIDSGKLKFECLFPGAFLEAKRVPEVLKQLAVERQALHRKQLINSMLLMPVTIPFALVPIIPNLPFFYLVFRAWSHYRAWYGGRLLEYLTSKDLVRSTASPEMDIMYTAGLLHSTRQQSRDASNPTVEETEKVVKLVNQQTHGGKEDVMVLQRWNGKLIAEAFHLPEMEVEIERAVEQVRDSIKAKEESVGEKKEP